MQNTAGSNIAVYTEDLSDRFSIFIIRKLEDGKGCLWTVKIPRKVIRNIIKAFKAPEDSSYEIEEEKISTTISIESMSD